MSDDLVMPLRTAAYLAFEDGTNDYTTPALAAARIAELEIAHDEWKDMSLKLAAELYSRFGTERPPFLPALFENERKKLRSYDGNTARIAELETALRHLDDMIVDLDAGHMELQQVSRFINSALAGGKDVNSG